MKIVEAHFLHGFLGLPSDWDAVELGLNATFKGEGVLVRPIKRNLWADIERIYKAGPHGVEEYFQLWARQFEKELLESPHDKIFVGYSFGARLLMHVNWQVVPKALGVFLISGHPGLNQPTKLKSRRMSDLLWADDFIEQPWNQLMDRWNSQAVFNNETIISREEKSYSRHTLSRYFRHLSLGLQNPWKPKRMQLELFRWVYGEDDKIYRELSKEVAGLIGPHNILTIENCGHRVPISHPKEIVKMIGSFLESQKRIRD